MSLPFISGLALMYNADRLVPVAIVVDFVRRKG